VPDVPASTKRAFIFYQQRVTFVNKRYDGSLSAMLTLILDLLLASALVTPQQAVEPAAMDGVFQQVGQEWRHIGCQVSRGHV
jgi:hypothetical protein